MKFANLDVFTWLSWFRSLNSLHDKIHDTTPFQFNLSLFMITNHSSYKIHTKFHITFFGPGSILSSRCVFLVQISNSKKNKKKRWKSLHFQPLEAVKEPVKPQEVIRKVSPEAKAAKTTKQENKETRSDLVSQQRKKRIFFILAMVEVDLCDDLCMFFVDWWWCVVPFVSICCMIWY